MKPANCIGVRTHGAPLDGARRWGKRIAGSSLGIVAALVLCAQSATSFAADGNPNVKRELVGKISYRLIDSGAYRGEEDWRLTIHPDGTRTMRMTNPIDDEEIWRDIVLRVDARGRPLDSYQSLWNDGVHKGSAFYWSEDKTLRVVARAPTGTLQQSVEVPEHFSLGTRPQAAFGWHLWSYDYAARGKQQINVFLISREGLGVGSILGDLQPFEVELLGEERITVPAGTFDAWHFRVGPNYEFWMDKKDGLTLRLLGEYKNRVYELVELSEVVRQ